MADSPPLHPKLQAGAIVQSFARPNLIMDAATGRWLREAPTGVEIGYESVGEISVPTGRLIAADYGIPDSQRPFRHRLPAAQYEVEVVTATSLDESLVAYLVLRVGHQTPVRWKLARRVGEWFRIGAIGVDHGAVGLADESCINEWSDQVEEDAFPEIAEETSEAVAAIKSFEGGGDMAIAMAGRGDGVYDGVWGLDRSGRVGCLVIDFGIIDNGLIAPTLCDKRGETRYVVVEDEG